MSRRSKTGRQRELFDWEPAAPTTAPPPLSWHDSRSWWCPVCEAQPGEPCTGRRVRQVCEGDDVGPGWVHGMRAQMRMGPFDPRKSLDMQLAWMREDEAAAGVTP